MPKSMKRGGKPNWKREELFPIIARIIEQEYAKLQDFVTRDEIAQRLSKDGEAQGMVQERILELNAGNIIDWFSSAFKQCADGRKGYLSEYFHLS
ncbi:MAG TPA: hypothetical protein VNE63_14940 [Candidatus Acidoferrales bacterium]|nr:hypothetical protein [Candidatus Acidoferrales bacterium]